MCDDTAFAPACEEPDFMSITGFFCVTFFITSTNLSPSLIPSRYPRITSVLSSSASCSITSISDMSALFPRLTTLLNPIPSDTLQSIIATVIAPLCDTNAMFPGSGIICANDAFSGVCISKLPRQLGPWMFMSYFLAIADNSSSSFTPSPPTSLNPAVRTMTFLIPLCPHSSKEALVNFEGIATTAKSHSPSISKTDLYAFNPNISPSALMFIGYISP